MAYKHAFLNTLLLLHSTLMLSMVKMSLKEDVGGYALISHGNYIVDHGKSLKNHGIVFLYFCGNLDVNAFACQTMKCSKMRYLSYKPRHEISNNLTF